MACARMRASLHCSSASASHDERDERHVYWLVTTLQPRRTPNSDGCEPTQPQQVGRKIKIVQGFRDRPITTLGLIG